MNRNNMNMARPYSHSSLGRDMMNVGPGPKLGGHPGSRNLLSGPSSKNLPSIFSLGSRAPPPLPPPAPHRDEPNQAKILASFGLSSRDLDELSRFPEEKITPDSLPQLIQQIKRRRSEDMLSYRERIPREPLRPSSSDWDDDVKPYRRESFLDRPSGLEHVVDYDHGSRSREPAFRERLRLDDQLRDRERFREDSYLSDPPFRKPGTDFEPMGYSQPRDRSVFEKTRGMPSIRNVDDFHGLVPKDFPHLCSLCDIPLHTKKGWHDHTNGPTHRRHRMLLLEVYPEWQGHGMGDPALLQQSTNHAPGLLGPPPPPRSLLAMGGGPEGRRGPPRPHLDDDRGPRRGPNRMHGGGGRVVHIINFERGRNLKNQLLRLAEPFGIVTNHLILNKMNEAFIEMSNAEDAMAIIDYYSTNPALVMGKPVRVHLSQKYKRIKKMDQRSEKKPEEKKTEPGRVIHISKLPSLGFTDAALLKLAENFGKVKSYILMRVRNQAFVEMEKAEDAQNMVKQCETVPLVFHGKALKIDLSERYKKLVLRIPNKLLEEKERKRKRGHSPDHKGGAKEKQKKTDGTEEKDEGQAGEASTEDTVHTSEEADQKDLVSDSCEPELVEEDEEEETAEEVNDEEAEALLETNSSVADDDLETSEIEQKDAGEEGQTEEQEPGSSDPTQKMKRSHKYSGSINDFVTLDEVGDDEDSDKGKAAGQSAEVAEEMEQENYAEAEDMETCKPTGTSGGAQDKGSNAATSKIPELARDYVLPMFEPNNPIGVGFVVPKTGFYCKLCSLFYTNEDVAKVTHCSTLPHYQKLKKLLNKKSTNPEKKN